MQEVISLLIKEYPDAQILLFGRGKDEDNTFPQWIKEMPQCVSVAQHIDNMQQELILMSHLNVMISMDSANMHLASLVNTPVVSIWGATHPMAGFLGWHQNKDNAVQLDMECRPCSIYGKTKLTVMKKYVCDVCGYVYDPAVGDPDGGIAPGTAFEDIPEDWVCPICGVGKGDFSPEE